MRKCSGLLVLAVLLCKTFAPAAPAQAADSLAVFVVVPEAGARSIYELRFSLNSALPPAAQLEIVFPEGLDLSEVMVVGSNTIDGGLSFQRQGQRLTIRRSGLGHTLPSGKTLDLKIANIRNPRRLSGGLEVRVTVRSQEGATVELASPVMWRTPPQLLTQ